MNQILFTGEKNNKSMQINKIIIVFCVIIIIFAISLISKGIYGLMQDDGNQKIQSNQNKIEPEVEVIAQGSSASINIKHNVTINSVTYSFNDGEDLEINDANGKNRIETQVQLPNEDTILKIKITDANKNEYVIEKEFKYDKNMDLEDPKLEISSVIKISQSISVIATDNEAISCITYKWDEDEEVVISNDGSDIKRMETQIDLQEGKKKLTVTAIDDNGNTTSQQKDIVVVTPPEITLKKNKGELIIRVTDNEEVTKVVYEINGNQYTRENNGENKKEFEIKELLAKGENIVKVTAYNNHNVTSEKMGKCTY